MMIDIDVVDLCSWFKWKQTLMNTINKSIRLNSRVVQQTEAKETDVQSKDTLVHARTLKRRSTILEKSRDWVRSNLILLIFLNICRSFMKRWIIGRRLDVSWLWVDLVEQRIWAKFQRSIREENFNVKNCSRKRKNVSTKMVIYHRWK